MNICLDRGVHFSFTVDADNDKVKKIKDQLTPELQKTVIIKSARPYIVDEVTKKIRDTTLGLFASYRNKETALSSYSQSLFTINNQPILVLLDVQVFNLRKTAGKRVS